MNIKNGIIIGLFTGAVLILTLLGLSLNNLGADALTGNSVLNNRNFSGSNISEHNQNSTITHFSNNTHEIKNNDTNHNDDPGSNNNENKTYLHYINSNTGGGIHRYSFYSESSGGSSEGDSSGPTITQSTIPGVPEFSTTTLLIAIIGGCLGIAYLKKE
jgi:hypothetical protein